MEDLLYENMYDLEYDDEEQDALESDDMESLFYFMEAVKDLEEN